MRKLRKIEESSEAIYLVSTPKELSEEDFVKQKKTVSSQQTIK